MCQLKACNRGHVEKNTHTHNWWHPTQGPRRHASMDEITRVKGNTRQSIYIFTPMCTDRRRAGYAIWFRKARRQIQRSVVALQIAKVQRARASVFAAQRRLRRLEAGLSRKRSILLEMRLKAGGLCVLGRRLHAQVFALVSRLANR